jgi:hypothetical protein
MTFEVEADGSSVQLHLLDRDGSAVTVELPFACLRQLLMTLPNLIRTALQKSHGDDSFRLAYPIERYRLELGEAEPYGARQFILSVQTSDGFSVSFAAPANVLAEFARSILEDIASHPSGSPHTNNN